MTASVARFDVGEYTRAGGIVAVATLLCLALRTHLATVDVAMVLLLGVVAAAARYRRGPALLASFLSTAAFDFLFVPPYYTFNVFDSAYFLTFAVMLVVALTMSSLTTRIHGERVAADARERQTAALYALETDLTAAADLETMRDAAAPHFGRIVGGSARLLLTEELGAGDGPDLPDSPLFQDAEVRVAAAWAWNRRTPTGWNTAYGSEAAVMVLPLVLAAGPVGLAIIRPDDPDRQLTPGQVSTLGALADLTARAIERRMLARDGERARAAVEAEKLRTALLSSLSHDLRTPLAGIEGAASSLLDGAVPLPDEVRRELIEGILDESRRMTRLVGNLLDMVRVETGTLAVQKSWQPLEEALGVALLRMEDQLQSHPVTARIPEDLPLVAIDELLIEQVLLNLLENAIRYTPAGTPIEISARPEDDAVLVEVADRGPGISAGEQERVFDRFYRGVTAGVHATGAGSGLGLTICRGIIAAHGGRIWIAPRTGGGTAVRFTLPCSGAPAQTALLPAGTP
ncbi:MAG: ATP-binding protein [Gemmatimonadales bacterium]